LSELAIRGVAVLSIVALTLLNCRGVRLGATTQNILTTLKMGALAALIVTSFGLHGGSTANLQPLWPAGPASHWIGPFGIAMVSVLWAYDGWIETTYVGSEIVDPGRNLPRSIILSTIIVIAFYVLASSAYLYVLSPSGVAKSALVASDAARVTIGAAGAAFVARDGLFFRSQAYVHPRYATPTVALLTQGAIASVLTLLGTYNQLILYVVFAQFVFYALSAGAVMRLRHTAPQVARPYRTWGYPVTPLVFIAFAAWLVYNTIVETPKDSAIGAGLILLGLPGYYYWRRRGAGGR